MGAGKTSTGKKLAKILNCPFIDTDKLISEQEGYTISQLFETKGIEALRKGLLEIDPAFQQHGDINNPNQMMRAMEVVLHTGMPIYQFQINAECRGISSKYKIKYNIISLPREILYQRINERVDKMMDEGLEEEAKTVYPFKELTALQTVGYKELFDYFDCILTREAAVEKIKQHTRNYAKRQITWFKRYVDEDLISFPPPTS